jgi:hypothetical protein
MIVFKSFFDYVALIPLCFFLVPCQLKNHLCLFMFLRSLSMLMQVLVTSFLFVFMVVFFCKFFYVWVVLCKSFFIALL